MDLSKTIAQYIAATTYEDLPEDVIHFTKLCILDYFGSAFAGSSKPPIKMIEAFVREMGGEEQATLVTGGKTSVMNAALVNGAASHIVELDDIHKSSIIHAATVVIPAALAIAEWKRLSGKDLITEVVIGYEVCYRIGEAVSPSHYYYWHNTATCGTFGAAAATAKLFDLTVEEMIHSLGNAGTQAAGLWEFIEDGAMTKQLHPGKAAMNGVMSTMLAKKGFTGAQRILEGNRGFFEAMSEQYDASKITAGLGEEFKIMENSFKVHASCRHTHHAMDLMVELANGRTLSLKDIDQITVKTYQVAINITDNDEPDTVYAAKFSLQYCVALALLTGQGDLDAFSEKALWNDDIRSLMKKIDVQVDQTIDQMYPEKWGAEVEILLNSGETMLTETDFPKGDPENAVTADDLMQKYMKLAKKLPEAERRSFADKVMELESITNVEELMESIEIYKFM